MGLGGWVGNSPAGVTIEIQGDEENVAAFLSGFEQGLPPLARIDSVVTTKVPLENDRTFSIRESQAGHGESTPVIPDVSTCNDCLRELFDGSDRRYRYPFINCTNCGPRFTLVEDLPYDRSLTTMKSFRMCLQCQAEYDDPANRRFHAQPNACSTCGPNVWYVDGSANLQAFECAREPSFARANAIEAARSAIRAGRIVAIKGIGGFHLACDATNEAAVNLLRQRKNRTDKPLAVMATDLTHASTFASINQQEKQLLIGRERPIVLVRKRKCRETNWLDRVAPSNDFVGVVLPYSPLHYLLMEAMNPLVMTSANISDEPIVRTNLEAKQRLSNLADSFLLHDREIHMVCDDSVLRSVDSSPLLIRRSRGYAPTPVIMKSPGPDVLAVGGELKSTICVTKGEYAYVSPHIGDMGNLETLEALERSVDHFLKLFRVDVKKVAADLHPGYLSGQWAERFAKSLNVPLVRVQHHFAHAASLMVEHQWPADQPLLVCCFDGTGYGSDGAIWGGEFILASMSGFDRVAHWSYFPLPGGDASIRKPYRTALAQLWSSDLAWHEQLPCVSACPLHERQMLRRQLENNINCVPTSSLGRLFDAIASLLGVRQEVTYEAQAAMELEVLASGSIDKVDPNSYAVTLHDGDPTSIDSRCVVRQISDDVLRGVDPSVVAAKFHHAIATVMTRVCQKLREQRGIQTVGLSGGVFQNACLLKLAKLRLAEAGFEVLTHLAFPPNDGGLALGQAMIARNQARFRKATRIDGSSVG